MERFFFAMYVMFGFGLISYLLISRGRKKQSETISTSYEFNEANKMVGTWMVIVGYVGIGLGVLGVIAALTK
jgi:uncharacterized membrane protein YiaA